MSVPCTPETIVVIDDDYAMRLSCRKILAKTGYRMEVFEDGAQGLDGIARLKPGLVLVDLKMPGMSGMEVISRVHAIDPDIILVVITGYATIDTAVEAMKSGAYDFLPKPFSPEELRLVVSRGLERRRLILDARKLEMEKALLNRRFVTFVSHQLQTPLVAVHQYLDVLRQLGNNPEIASKGQEWIGRSLKRIEEMQAMVKDWLALSQIESGSLSHHRERVDIGRIIANILETYESEAASERIRLRAVLPEAGCYVRGDWRSLTVLFDNLIANAVKYNRPAGEVTITAETCDGQVSVTVTDTGIGIPEKDIPHLFSEFFRVQEEGDRKRTGTGLGLAICKKIVTEAGGSIAVASEIDRGSVFRVSLPAWREEGSQAA